MSDPEWLGISRLAKEEARFEFVERKGKGHPDTMADALAEEFSRALCNHYQENFGVILHHNVDKLLIAAGRASPAFNGGSIDEPFDVFLSGRATWQAQGITVPMPS